MMSSSREGRVVCDHPGCNKSYIRTEHLNRHSLTHKQRAFVCYFCKKPFTRNDLLQVHLRRHETRSFENAEKQREPTPPHQGHRDALLRRTNPMSLALTPILAPDTTLGEATPPVTNNQVATGQAEILAEILQPVLGMSSFGSHDVSNFYTRDSLTYKITLDSHGVHVKDALSQNQDLSDTEYQVLINEYPNLKACNQACVLKFIEYGRDYLEASFPYLHRATFTVSAVPILSLTLCSLGMALSGISEVEKIGQMISTHVSRRLTIHAMESDSMEVSILQAMLILEHVGRHTSTRHDHQKAEIIHAILVTLCRQSSLLVQNGNEFSALQDDIENRWKAWIEHETTVRLVHSVFVSDILHSIHFMQPSLLSTEMLNVPLPSHERLWQAKTADEWATLTTHYQGQKSKPLQTVIKVLFPESHAQSTHDLLFHELPSRPDMFTMQILITTIASAVIDHQHHSIHCLSSHAVSLLKMEDFKLALERWRHHFTQINMAKQENKIGASALVTYHFIWILLHHDMSFIMKVASSTSTVGSFSDPQGAQVASSSSLASRPISASSFLHALEIIDMCLSIPTEESQPVSILDKQHDLSPLSRSYTAFLGVLVAWAYTLSNSVRHLSGVNVTQDPSAPGLSNQFENEGLFSNPNPEIVRARSGEALPLVWRSESGETTINTQDFDATKDDVYKLMKIVRGRLAKSSWILAQESSQILDVLLHNAGLD